MRRAPPVWSIEDVAAWLDESVSTSRRLPPVRVQGYFSVWPAIVRKEWEALSRDEPVYHRFPPSRRAGFRGWARLHSLISIAW